MNGWKPPPWSYWLSLALVVAEVGLLAVIAWKL
jgi:hypothetical protein